MSCSSDMLAFRAARLRRRPPQGAFGHLPVGTRVPLESVAAPWYVGCLLELVALTAATRSARGLPEPGRQARYPIGLFTISAEPVV
jgi:hypothetical protein